MQLHFADDAQEQPVDVFHKLKLYSDIDPTNQTTKKPVRGPQVTDATASSQVCHVTSRYCEWEPLALPARKVPGHAGAASRRRLRDVQRPRKGVCCRIACHTSHAVRACACRW